MNNEDVYNNLEIFYDKFNIKQMDYVGSIVEYIKQIDDILVLKFPNEIDVSGMVMIKKDRDKEYKCIYINTNETEGRQNFTFMHELYHAYFEKAPRTMCVSEIYEHPIEKRADTFASNILIPRKVLLGCLKDLRYNEYKTLDLQDVFKLQKLFKVSAQAIIYAVDNLEKDERYYKYRSIIPKLDENFKKYYRNNWDELERLTLEDDPNNRLNSYTKKVEFPLEFKQDIITNYRNKLTTYEDAKIIFGFFNEKFDM